MPGSRSNALLRRVVAGVRHMVLHVALSSPGRVCTNPYTIPAVKVEDAAALRVIFDDLLHESEAAVCSFSVIGSFTRQFMRGAKWSR